MGKDAERCIKQEIPTSHIVERLNSGKACKWPFIWIAATVLKICGVLVRHSNQKSNYKGTKCSWKTRNPEELSKANTSSTETQHLSNRRVSLISESSESTKVGTKRSGSQHSNKASWSNNWHNLDIEVDIMSFKSTVDVWYTLTKKFI